MTALTAQAAHIVTHFSALPDCTSMCFAQHFAWFSVHNTKRSWRWGPPIVSAVYYNTYL